jgi:FAD/FMN-containing dehydrogenase
VVRAPKKVSGGEQIFVQPTTSLVEALFRGLVSGHRPQDRGDVPPTRRCRGGRGHHFPPGQIIHLCDRPPVDVDDPGDIEGAKAFNGELVDFALARGGTCTGEHGIGVLKRRWLRDELGARQWELQRDIKRVFDPTGILNPGVVFAD